MSHIIEPIVEPNPIKDSFSDIQDEENHETITANSQYKNSHKSLLTKALKTSSEKSQQEGNDSEFWSQIILRPKLQDYSQPDDETYIDDMRKMSLHTVISNRKSKQKIMTEFVEEKDPSSKYNSSVIRRREIKLKIKEEGCARCEIF